MNIGTTTRSTFLTVESEATFEEEVDPLMKGNLTVEGNITCLGNITGNIEDDDIDCHTLTLLRETGEEEEERYIWCKFDNSAKPDWKISHGKQSENGAFSILGETGAGVFSTFMKLNSVLGTGTNQIRHNVATLFATDIECNGTALFTNDVTMNAALLLNGDLDIYQGATDHFVLHEYPNIKLYRSNSDLTHACEVHFDIDTNVADWKINHETEANEGKLIISGETADSVYTNFIEMQTVYASASNLITIHPNVLFNGIINTATTTYFGNDVNVDDDLYVENGTINGHLAHFDDVLDAYGLLSYLGLTVNSRSALGTLTPQNYADTYIKVQVDGSMHFSNVTRSNILWNLEYDTGDARYETYVDGSYGANLCFNYSNGYIYFQGSSASAERSVATTIMSMKYDGTNSIIKFDQDLPGGTGNDVVIDGSGQLKDGTASSKRFKDIVGDFTEGRWILKLNPKEFYWKNDRRCKEVGLIAEETVERFPRDKKSIASYDRRSRIKGYKRDVIVSGLINLVKEQNKRIDQLEESVEFLMDLCLDRKRKRKTFKYTT